MQYIDSHAHILPHFFDDIPSIIQQAQKQHIDKIINIATRAEEFNDVLDLHHQYPNYLYPALAIHPEEVFSQSFVKLLQDLHLVEKHASEHILIALGEIGLEYKDAGNRLKEIKKNQIFFLNKQIEIAIKNDLPMIFHCREALHDLISVLKTYAPIRGVLHSADGEMTDIQELLDMGLYVSFNGIMTFKHAEHINMLVKTIPLDRILLETDSPFLAPIPVRGTQNTPANMPYIYQYLAQLKNISEEQIQRVVNTNVCSLFHIEQ